MGGSGSTRRVSFEADENDNITVVKGIRLSDNVINRMREPTSVTRPQTPPPSAPPQAKFPAEQPVTAGYTVNEEELRRKIAEELALEQARRESANQKRLDHGILMQEEIGKVLERERNSSTEQLTRAVLREKAATEDERLKAKTFARKLEEKERDLKRQDEYYKEQLARLEERSAQFYKVTTDQYQEAANTVEARFKRYESHPVCADLQAQILQCYQQNPQQTLSCSVLASQYMQCVNNAKQSMLGRGG
ncbi:MICOS complex subunit MIC19 isoform X2 [Rana temporaria]|uniref:MICOS complex subunit MIC19 isoform X2 n=1 Tax=Rana temporaria TaxID=8407 RepID=UPI001AADB129|nr:MICOS complex subunit MIC19 isoform X2 [Rana temporaria]